MFLNCSLIQSIEELRIHHHLLPKLPTSYYTDRTIWAANIKPYVASKSGIDLAADFNSNHGNYHVIKTHDDSRYKLKV